MQNNTDQSIRTINELIDALGITSEAKKYLDVMFLEPEKQKAIMQSLAMLGCSINIETTPFRLSVPLPHLDKLAFNPKFREQCGLMDYDGSVRSAMTRCKTIYYKTGYYTTTASILNQNMIPTPNGFEWTTEAAKAAVLGADQPAIAIVNQEAFETRWRSYCTSAITVAITKYTPRALMECNFSAEISGQWCIIFTPGDIPVAVRNLAFKAIQEWIPQDAIVVGDMRRKDEVVKYMPKLAIPLKEQVKYGLDNPYSYPIGSDNQRSEESE